MFNEDKLRTTLEKIDGLGYKAYQDIAGVYNYRQEGFELHIDHIQADPFAPASRMHIVIDQKRAGFPTIYLKNKSREVAFCDYIARNVARAIFKFSKGHRGSGKSGRINIDVPGQEIVEQSAVIVKEHTIEVRITVGLPAYGRRISGEEAMAIFFDEIPVLVEESLFYFNMNKNGLREFIQVNEDSDALRAQLEPMGLVAFVANQSILPRLSGIDDRPMPENEAIPFSTPPSLETCVDLPNAGKVWGMGIPKGVTVIVGGGFHGKSTLLQAIEKGVYNHRPGDGREKVITDGSAFKVRSEDGRFIYGTNISPFINNLPHKKSTSFFCTENASGSTSQAANIVEALEAESKVLLIDEDTSATNFMIRDRRMQLLIAKDKEPITPLVDKVRALYEEHGVSTILVVGGSGDYLDKADLVLAMDEFVPIDITDQAKNVVNEIQTSRKNEGGNCFGPLVPRTPVLPINIFKRGKRQVKPQGKHSLLIGDDSIELSAMEQLIHESQTRAIGEAIALCNQNEFYNKTLSEIANLIIQKIDQEGLDVLSKSPSGNLARFRKQELLGALSRMRSLKIKNR